MLFWILKFLPRNHVSYWVGKLAHLRIPKFLAKRSIYCFAKIYKINLNESEKRYDEYLSIGDFFTRRLKDGVRPISSAGVVHPADSRISQLGSVDEGFLLQVKGKRYGVGDLTKSMDLEKYYFQGFFVTYYLCPTDYHRVHSPVNGKIIRVTHIPGTLWPVNNWSVTHIENLFTINERVVVEIECEQGLVSVIFVGATNVGKISISFDSKIVTNNLKKIDSEFMMKSYSPPRPINRGEELGVFHMGSTVVVLYPESLAPQAENWQEWLGQRVKMGGRFF